MTNGEVVIATVNRISDSKYRDLRFNLQFSDQEDRDYSFQRFKRLFSRKTRASKDARKEIKQDMDEKQIKL